jgi:hypothetical protein
MRPILIRLLFVPLLESLLVATSKAADDSISVGKSCYQVGEPISVSFENGAGSELFGDWVGILRASDTTTMINPQDIPAPAMWMWTCGGQSMGTSCQFSISGTLLFDANSESDDRQEWPLATGQYRAVLSISTGAATFVADAFSIDFTIQDQPCDEEEDLEETLQDGASVTVDQSCYEVGEEIAVTFETMMVMIEGQQANVNVNVDDDDDWVGLYRTNNLNDLANLDPVPSMWMWTCGSQNCNSRTTDRGTMSFSIGSDSTGTQGWPLEAGEYQAVLTGGNTPYQAHAISQPFIVGCSSSSTPPGTTDLDDDRNMAEVIAQARSDITALIDNEPTLGAKFLRLAFHDCVGGCDGECVLRDLISFEPTASFERVYYSFLTLPFHF